MEIDWVRRLKLLIAAVCFTYCCVEPFGGRPSWSEGFELWHLLPSFPFFVLGMIIKEKRLDLTAMGQFEAKLLLGVLFLIITLIQGKVDLAGYKYGLSFALFFFNAVVGSYLLFSISNAAPPQKQWITSLSTGTLLILGLHGLIYPQITSLMHELLGLFNPYTPFFVALLILFICYPLIVLCEKHFPLLLGKMH